MHLHAFYAGQATLGLNLAVRTSGARDAGDSAVMRAEQLPFIGVGTFLVAAYLRSRLCPELSADGGQASHA
jgi:hypothetical protein